MLSYKVLTAQEIKNLRKEHDGNPKVEEILEAGNGYGCMIAIVTNSEPILDKRKGYLEIEAMNALSPLCSKEFSMRIMDVMMLDDKNLLVYAWQGETIYSNKEKLRIELERRMQKK